MFASPSVDLELNAHHKIEAAARPDEITAIAGIATDYWHAFWKDCNPEHATPIKFDLFKPKVPINLRNSLTEKISYLNKTGLPQRRRKCNKSILDSSLIKVAPR